MKEKLIIKNFGPIKDVELELGRFNILIGEQATGKSTVAKLLAVCRYFTYILDFDYFEKEGSSFSWGLISWGLDEAIQPNTYIYYSCKHYEFEGCAVKTWHDTWLSDGEQRNRFDVVLHLVPRSKEFEDLLNAAKKISSDSDRFSLSDFPVTFFQNIVAAVLDNPFYLPAERGLQSIFSLGKTSIQNLSDALFNQFADLDRIARLFKSETAIEPLDIVYKNENGQGFIRKKSEETFYSLFNAATGYQSVIPIVLSIKYYNTIRRKKKTFLIEEPELNLFPKAQNKLMEFLVEVIMINGHSVLLTTHSPYVLTSLNNCLYAAQVGKLKPDAAAKIIPQKNWLDINEVSAYRLMTDGTAKNIVDQETAQLEVERIDEISDELSREWHRLADLKFSNTHEFS